MEILKSAVESSFVFFIRRESILGESFFQYLEVIINESNECLMFLIFSLRLDLLMSFSRNGSNVKNVMFIDLDNVVHF